VRQPQVAAPLAALVVALVLAAPVLGAAHALVVASAFVVEFLSDGRVPALTVLTPAPGLAAVRPDTDLYRSRGMRRAAPMVLVHGLAADGKNDPRLRRAARLLARAGFDVAVPTIPGLTRGRLRPDDARPVVAALAARAEPAALVTVSVGAGPGFLAAADPSVATRVRVVLGLGAYGSAVELIRFYLTGDYAFGAARGHVDHDRALVGQFIDANGELVSPAVRQALLGGEPAAVDAALAALSPETRVLLADLSPANQLPRIGAPVVLVHGRNDPAVPYTESLRLAAARPRGTRVVLVGPIAHVEAARARAAELLDVARLVGVVYAMR
jgi:pimeloyl-ACP methyl ester carboxylesterase